MPSLPDAELPPLFPSFFPSRRPSPGPEAALPLVVRIDARAHGDTLREVTQILRRRCPALLLFLGEVNGRLALTVTFADPGMHAAEALARRLIRVNGVHGVDASLTDPARGERYAVRLSAGKGQRPPGGEKAL